MAEFQEVMKQYNRMFEAHKKGFSIPVEASYETAVKQPDFFEECVMSWAAEHPEPTTVYEWLVSLGLLSADMWSISDLHKPIPADIAQKLGIEPKEGT